MCAWGCVCFFVANQLVDCDCDWRRHLSLKPNEMKNKGCSSTCPGTPPPPIRAWSVLGAWYLTYSSLEHQTPRAVNWKLMPYEEREGRGGARVSKMLMLFLITAVLLENGPWNKASPPIVVTLGCCRRVCLCARVCVCGGVGYSCNDDPAELEVCARPPVSHRSVFLPLSSLRSMCTLRTRKAVFWWWGGGVGKTCQTRGECWEGLLSFIFIYFAIVARAFLFRRSLHSR